MMKSPKTQKLVIALAAVLVLIAALTACLFRLQDQRIPVRVLILPKFEIDEITGDFPGEAQFFYEEYLAGGDEYKIEGCPDTNRLYYKDGVAMVIVGQGKVDSALNTFAVLSDRHFDFSDAYILSVGCGGAAEGYGVLGDVFVISAAVDYDLGHQADPREMSGGTETTWFHDEEYDDVAVVRLDQSLTDHVFERVKNVRLETTENTVRYLYSEYPGEAWARRHPQVKLGTSVTGDNYWKGIYDHQNALLITETYGCRDPFAITEMEDVAVAQAVGRFGLLERLMILRVGVNMDVFPSGMTPEMLWREETDDFVAAEVSLESMDIFVTAMQNCFATGKVLIDAILEGTL